MTLADLLGEEPVGCDYSLWPGFSASIGYTHRGCDLRCKHCFVPTMEPGGPISTGTIASLWRGEGHPRHIHLLDNSFFAQPAWRERIAEIREGGYKVCFSQGINIRSMTPEVAKAIASIEYRDTKFERSRLYCAWDVYNDEDKFFRGVDLLAEAGVAPSRLMAYMLTGFDKSETFERIERRFWTMANRGIRPYPMVFLDETTGEPRNGLSARDLKRFQRWVILQRYHACAFQDFDESVRDRRAKPSGPDLFNTAA